ncbi:MAG: hypothetical protein M3Y42_13845 [Actinomycetota bacterium]|nr:hypothetical protein [Actinomycetota bacterium]MDQ2958035.1 hypothetical protein [Actinomycetota bacterium]
MTAPAEPAAVVRIVRGGEPKALELAAVLVALATVARTPARAEPTLRRGADRRPEQPPAPGPMHPGPRSWQRDGQASTGRASWTGPRADGRKVEDIA